jgi:hypothetical protein
MGNASKWHSKDETLMDECVGIDSDFERISLHKMSAEHLLRFCIRKFFRDHAAAVLLSSDTGSTDGRSFTVTPVP